MRTAVQQVLYHSASRQYSLQASRFNRTYPGLTPPRYWPLTAPARFASFTEASNGSGDPLFIGVLDTTADITKITVNMSACGGLGCNPNDFAVDTLYLKETVVTTGTPEPSSTLMLAGGLALLLGWRGRRYLHGPTTRRSLAILAAVVFAAAVAPAVFAQSDVLTTPQVLNDSKAVAALHSSKTITSTSQPIIETAPLPIGLYSIVGYDGNTYQGEIVGRSPWARGLRTTSVSVVLIPLIVKTPSKSSGNFTADPTSEDAGCLGGTNTALSLTQASLDSQYPTDALYDEWCGSGRHELQ